MGNEAGLELTVFHGDQTLEVVVGEHVHGQLLGVDHRLHLAQFEPNVVFGCLDDVREVFLNVTPTKQAEDGSEIDIEF